MKTDKRIVRTHKLIREAFLNLLLEKKYSDITINDISDLASINRNTFYLHFADKEDLLEKYTDESVAAIIDCLGDENFSIFEDAIIFNSIQKAFEVIDKNKTFYRVMMSESNASLFTYKLERRLKEQVLAYTPSPNAETIFYVEFLISGFLGVTRLYLQSDNYDRQTFTNLLIKYVSSKPTHLLRKF